MLAIDEFVVCSKRNCVTFHLHTTNARANPNTKQRKIPSNRMNSMLTSKSRQIFDILRCVCTECKTK